MISLCQWWMCMNRWRTAASERALGTHADRALLVQRLPDTQTSGASSLCCAAEGMLLCTHTAVRGATACKCNIECCMVAKSCIRHSVRCWLSPCVWPDVRLVPLLLLLLLLQGRLLHQQGLRSHHTL